MDNAFINEEGHYCIRIGYITWERTPVYTILNNQSTNKLSSSPIFPQSSMYEMLERQSTAQF